MYILNKFIIQIEHCILYRVVCIWLLTHNCLHSPCVVYWNAFALNVEKHPN